MANKFGNWFHGEREKLRELTGKEKIQYIWSYYYIWIIGITAFLAISIFLTVRITTSVKEEWLYAMFANTMADAGNGSEMWKDFTEYSELDLKEKRVEFNAEAYFDYLKNQAKGNDYYNAFVALTDAGILDIITMETPSLAALAESGRLTDLNLERCQALRDRYADRLVYFHGVEGDIPVGIDISDSKLVTRYGLYKDSCALGIGAQSQKIDIIALFLQFILEEK
jgi:hypothetical protein